MSTQAVRALRDAGAPFTTHNYDAQVLDGSLSYGEGVAAALDVAPERLFKTLITVVDDITTVAIVPVSRSLDLKALAAAASAKKAAMADPRDAERATGYVTGGISPFGQRRSLPTFVDSTINDHDLILVSGGKRGLQIEVSPRILVSLLQATTAQLT